MRLHVNMMGFSRILVIHLICFLVARFKTCTPQQLQIQTLLLPELN